MSERARELIQAALPAYEIGNELGRGAFGVVYEARHTQLGRSVAIKQLPQSFAEDEEVRGRFVAEAQMVASLEHPHIVPVYDFVESNGSRYLIMEKCAGSVGDRFKEEGIVTDEACAAVLACLAALDFAHAKGLLHRDVKPENLMYDTKGVVKLGDFGIARDLGVDTRRTATGMIVGTPAYMSPEQCRGDDLTPASDVYSVAMMGYELLTGALPFPSTTSVNGLLAHHLVTVPTPLLQTRPELPGSVGEVIDRALAKDLNVRYGTAEEFAVALARACVTAFGSGWLRRRRFILHWPEIIAETERPDTNSPRTGTIVVRAGDLPHAVVVPEDEVEPVTPSQVDVPPAQSQPAQPQPVAVLDDPDAPTITSTTPTSTTPTSTPAAGAPPATPPGTPPPAATPLAPTAPPESSGPNWPIIGGIAAAIIAVVAVVIALTGGGSGGNLTVTGAEPTAAAEATPPGDSAAGDEPAPDGQTEPTAVPGDEPTAAPDSAATTEPTEVAPTPTTEVQLTETGHVVQPFVQGSNGNPIPNYLPGFDDDPFDNAIADWPWRGTPCPLDQPKLVCMELGPSVNEEDGTLTTYWFTLGFTPELEPIGDHIHFYIPEVVDGDENKAGTGVPGGGWREWDGPWPAESFGGDNGRTMFTMADFKAAGSTTLCAIVADAEHKAIPGSGNCAPVAYVLDEDFDTYSIMVNRIEGSWVGDCSTKAMAIAPSDWRWYDLTERPPAEIAAEIRPTNADAATELLEAFVNEGGTVWAEGPVENGFIVNFSMQIIPGDFTLNDDPRQVADVLSRLGIPVDNGGQRTFGDKTYYYEVSPAGDGISAATVVVPDYGYAISFTFTAPDGAGYSELASQIAYTVTGC